MYPDVIIYRWSVQPDVIFKFHSKCWIHLQLPSFLNCFAIVTGLDSWKTEVSQLKYAKNLTHDLRSSTIFLLCFKIRPLPFPTSKIGKKMRIFRAPSTPAFSAVLFLNFWATKWQELRFEEMSCIECWSSLKTANILNSHITKVGVLRGLAYTFIYTTFPMFVADESTFSKMQGFGESKCRSLQLRDQLDPIDPKIERFITNWRCFRKKKKHQKIKQTPANNWTFNPTNE